MSRLSIPVKILLTAGLTYLAGLLLTTWAAVEFHWDVDSYYYGLRIGDLIYAGQIFAGVFAFVLASYLSFDRPLSKLRRAMNKAGEGDFLIRTAIGGESEVSALSKSFNRLLAKFTDLSAQKIQTDYDLFAAQEELRLKQVIETTNKNLENLVRDLSILYEVGQNINETIEVHTLYERIAEVLKRELELENFSLMVWDEKRQVLQVKAAFGFDEPDPILQMTLQGGEGIAGEVLKSGQMIYVPDALREPRFVRKGELQIDGSQLCVPLKYKGKTVGVINFGRAQPNGFSSHDIKMLTLVANQVALALANAKLYTQTRELSLTDELTGVYNRRHFGQMTQLEWKRAVRFHRPLSLLMADADHFKQYNDTYGHLKGDQVLKGIGQLLLGNLREVDTVARFGGEEFVVLLPDTDKKGALAVAEKLRQLVEKNIPNVTVSIGVSSYPDDVVAVEDLIDHADIALYEAKDKGRNRVLVYDGPKSATTEGEVQKPIDPKSRAVH